MFNVTSVYLLFVNTFEKVWNWLATHGITIDGHSASFLHLAFFTAFVGIVLWVFPFFGDDED